jgi:hypothetical protein
MLTRFQLVDRLIQEVEDLAAVNNTNKMKRSFIRLAGNVAGSLGSFMAFPEAPYTASRLLIGAAGGLAGGYIGDKVAKIAVKDKKPQIGIQTNANLQEYK